MTDARTHLDVDGRRVRVTNLDKVLWPSLGMTKRDLIHYYVRIAPVLLPHLADHPLTLHRFPDGVTGTHWYETRAPAHPQWLRTQEMHVFRVARDVHAPVVDDVAGLVWAANAGAIELHPYLGTTGDLRRPTAAVFDLDPGPPADLLDAARVALALRALLEDLGLVSLPKTSGGKGIHVYVPLNSRCDFDDTKSFVKALAHQLVERDPAHVVDVMTKSRRAGKVFVDWSQNDAGKSTIAPYSLRGLWFPTVSMPLAWHEVDAAVSHDERARLVFVMSDVEGRLDRFGDLFEPAVTCVQTLDRTPA